jgi:hypothetical protein
MSTTQTLPHDTLARLAGRAVETVAVSADASQKVLRELVELSATTAREGVRLFAELQSGALEALRDGQAYALRRQAEWAEATRDPLGSYQKSVLESVEGAQKAVKLAEIQTQAVTRSAERLQVTAEQAGKEIQAALTHLAGTLKTLYTPLA